MSTRTKIYTQVVTRKVPIAVPSTNDNKTVRWQIQIIPAEDATLTAAEVTYPTFSAIEDHSVTDGRFKDGIFIGIPEQEEAEIKLQYKLLPDDLRDWITTASGVSVTIDGEDLWLSSVWILSTDAGDSALDPDEFEIRFIGCHYYQEEATYSFDADGYPIPFTVKLRSIGMACAEAVSIERLRTYIIDTGNTDGRPSTGSVYSKLFDSITNVAARPVYGWCQVAADPNHRAWLMSWRYFLDGILDCMAMTFSRYMRTHATSGGWATSNTFWVSDLRPFEASVELSEQLFDATRGPGDVLEFADWKYIGLVSRVPSPGDLSSTSPDWIGGLLGGSLVNGQGVGRGGDTIFGAENCWNLLRSLSENGCNKTLINVSRQAITGQWQLMIEPLLLLEDSEDFPTGRAEWIPPDFVKGTLQWHPSEVVVRSAECAVPGATDADETTIKKSTGSNTDAKPYAVTCQVHNLPTVRKVQEENPRRYSLQNIAEFTSPNLVIQTTGSFNTRTLYYETTPATFGNQQIALRVASSCSVNYAKTKAITVSGAALDDYPTPPVPPQGFPNVNNISGAIYDGTLFYPWAAMLIEEQRYANMLYAICGVVLYLFARNHPGQGNPHGTATLHGVLYGSHASSLVGRHINLSDFSEAVLHAALWDRSPAQTRVIITAVKAENMKAESQIEAVATSDDLFFEPT